MTHVRDRLAALRAEQDAYPARRAELVAEARAVGMTWREIADLLGMTQHGLLKAQARIVSQSNNALANVATEVDR